MPKSIGGTLLISNVMSIRKEILQMIANNQKIDLDMSDIKEIDSAGIALLIELKLTGRINFINQSNPVLNLCQLYKVII